MSHRLQILVPEALNRLVQKAAQRSRLSAGAWVRQAIESGGVNLVVCIERKYELSPRHRDELVPRLTEASVRAVPGEHPGKMWMPVEEVAGDLEGIVGRAIVEHDHFDAFEI